MPSGERHTVGGVSPLPLPRPATACPIERHTEQVLRKIVSEPGAAGQLLLQHSPVVGHHGFTDVWAWFEPGYLPVTLHCWSTYVRLSR